jgi:hypothetical protein
MATELKCWKCGTALKDLLLPLSRLAKCPACKADLHACRMCEFYDRTVNKMCREPIAEEVKDKQRANFCGYLQPNPRAYTPAGTNASKSQTSLEDLFNLPAGSAAGTTTDPDTARKQLEDLFGIGNKKK